MMPEDPKPQDPKPQDPKPRLRNEVDEPRMDATGPLSGEELLRWEEESYGIVPDGSDDAEVDKHPEEPEWFADLLDGRLDDQARHIREEALREDSDLELRYRAYTRTTQTLRALGKAEAEDRGSPFLKARILASIHEELTQNTSTGDASMVPVRKRGVIPALMGSMGVAAAALFGLLYLLEWGATDQHQPEAVKSAEGFYEDDVDGGVASAGRKVPAKGVAGGRSAPNAPRQFLDGVKSGGGGSSMREGMRSGESSQKLPSGELAKANRSSNKSSNGSSNKDAGKLVGEAVSSDAKNDAEKERGDFALGRGKKERGNNAWGNAPVPRAQGEAQGSDGFEGRAGQAQNDSAKGEAELLSKKSKMAGVAKMKSGARPPLESKPQKDKDVLELKEVADAEAEEAEVVAEEKAGGKTSATKKLDHDDPAAGARVVTVNPGKAGNVGAKSAYLEGLALLLDARGREGGARRGNLGTADGIPNYKVSHGRNEDQVLLFAVEMSPQQVTRVAPRLGLLEQQRLFFSRAGVTLAPRVGAIGGGADLPAVPEQVSGRPVPPGSPGSPTTGSGTPGSPTPGLAGDEARKSKGSTRSKSRDRGLTSAEPDDEEQRIEAKKRAFGQRIASGAGQANKVALHDLYSPDELYSTSNVVSRQGDEVLFLRGSKDQILSALKLLLEASDRHAVAYVPKSTMSPMEEMLRGGRMRKGMPVGQRARDEETKDDDGSVVKRARRSGKVSSKPAGDPRGKSPGPRPTAKAEDVPELIKKGPVTGTETGTGGVRKKADPLSPAKPSPSGQLSDKLAKQREDQFEIRVLIRRGRYAVPGRAGRSPTPGTPATPTPATPATGAPTPGATPPPDPRKNK